MHTSGVAVFLGDEDLLAHVLFQTAPIFTAVVVLNPQELGSPGRLALFTVSTPRGCSTFPLPVANPGPGLTAFSPRL